MLDTHGKGIGPRHDLGASLAVDAQRLVRAPVGHPQRAVAPAWRFQENPFPKHCRELRHQGLRLRLYLKDVQDGLAPTTKVILFNGYRPRPAPQAYLPWQCL